MAKYRVAWWAKNGRYAPAREHICAITVAQHLQVPLTTCRNLYVVNCQRCFCHPSPLMENTPHRTWKIPPSSETCSFSFTNWYWSKLIHILLIPPARRFISYRLQASIISNLLIHLRPRNVFYHVLPPHIPRLFCTWKTGHTMVDHVQWHLVLADCT